MRISGTLDLLPQPPALVSGSLQCVSLVYKIVFILQFIQTANSYAYTGNIRNFVVLVSSPLLVHLLPHSVRIFEYITYQMGFCSDSDFDFPFPLPLVLADIYSTLREIPP